MSSSSIEPTLAFTTLCTWPAHGILPSFDPECLGVLAHFAFSRLKVPIKKNFGRLMYYKERLPLVLGDNDNMHLAAGFNAIVDLCKKSHIDIDEQYYKCAADLLALNAFVKSTFIPAILDTFWLDDAYRSSIINIYGRSVGGFPLAYFYGKHKTESVKKQFSIVYGDGNLEQIRKSVFEKGKKAIDHLAFVLGEKPFLFGASPSSIDALVFGYLAPLVHGPTSNGALARYASSRRTLYDYIDRILTIYLSDLVKSDAVNASASTTSMTRTTNEDRIRDKVAVIAVGVLTMCAYAYLSGLIRIEVNTVE